LFGKKDSQIVAVNKNISGKVETKTDTVVKTADRGPGRNSNIIRPERKREFTGKQDYERRNRPASKPQQNRPRVTEKPKEPASKKEEWNISEYVVPPVEGKKRFLDFDLPVEVMHAISDLGFQYCTPIQAGILPKLLEGVDAAGRAQTGTGKTAAFLIAIITHLLRNPLKQPNRKAPRVLILAPTRELALQIKKDADGLSKYTDLKIVAVLGGIEYKEQRDLLAGERIDIVMATPGRLLDFKMQGNIHLDKVEILIIDEADRMLDMGFIPDVRRIIESTPPKTNRQTVLFSATLTPEVNRLASRWTREPSIVEIEPEQVVVKTIKQIFYLTTDIEKFKILYNLIAVRGLQRVMVFTNRKDTARDLKDHLSSHGISCSLLSGDVEQTRRIKRLESFRSGGIKVLVATDVAARGLHIEGISHVVNFTLPENPEDYVHRIGRTGRAGASGTAISFATETDSYFVPAIKKFLGEEIPSTYPDDDLLTPLPEPKFPLPKKQQSRGGRYNRGSPRQSQQGHDRGNRRSFKR
jgi:ATP-dependent RNA helicase RhlB